MKIKVSGAEYKAILEKDWPEEWEAEGVMESINGGPWLDCGLDVESLLDSDIVEIDGGVINTWDDLVMPPRGGYVGYIKRELARLTERRIVVVCDAAKLDAVMAAVRAAGGVAA